jgi:hypothetical protein
MEGVSRRLKTATYLRRFAPEERAELEQKVRIAAAMRHSPMTLAEALRMEARAFLDQMIQSAPGFSEGDARDEHEVE